MSNRQKVAGGRRSGEAKEKNRLRKDEAQPGDPEMQSREAQRFGGSLWISRAEHFAPLFFYSDMHLEGLCVSSRAYMNPRLSELKFELPTELLATEPQRPSRVLWKESDPKEPEEISIPELLERIPPGDALVINVTRVLKRRIFAEDSLEILFLESPRNKEWWVLFPASQMKLGSRFQLPGGVQAVLLEKGLPQRLGVDRDLDEAYFENYGELPVPPYIQKARNERHEKLGESKWYQTAWAQKPGSLASPTASLHFSSADRDFLEKKAVKVLEITLHVGLGTFLPIKVESLDQHKMHSEEVEIPGEVWREIQSLRNSGSRIWALGTTVARALESVPKGKLQLSKSGAWTGETDLFIYGDFEWQVVDRLLTNFHQPESTLLALVGSFAGLHSTLRAYQWAVEKKFRFFSYGDLSVWLR